jgi:CRP/FNR family cyclic AMP-dependent transcriptional regulator
MTEARRATQTFTKGQPIVTEGMSGDRTFLILSGEALVCKYNRQGELVPLAKLGPGDIFGEMYLFEPDRARSASVIATSAEITVEIYFQDEMHEIVRRMDPTVSSLLQGLNQRVRKTSECLVQSHSEPAKKTMTDKLRYGALKATGATFLP